MSIKNCYKTLLELYPAAFILMLILKEYAREITIWLSNHRRVNFHKLSLFLSAKRK